MFKLSLNSKSELNAEDLYILLDNIMLIKMAISQAYSSDSVAYHESMDFILDFEQEQMKTIKKVLLKLEATC